MAKEVTLLAVGDVLLDRQDPDSMFRHVAGFLRSGDVRFAQLEQTHSDKGVPGPIHASYQDLKNIPTLARIGVDVGGLAGNHALDWGADALLDTMARLQQAGIRPLGVGKDIEEAHRPQIVDVKGTKIAFLAYCCTGPDGYEAGVERPGFAAIRIHTLYEKIDYQPATPPYIISFAEKEDLDAALSDISKVRAEADIVVAVFHWGIHFVPAVIPMYSFEVGHAAIDAGADLILGCHAHMLKGIEMYKGKAIFHSLGNFALEMNPFWRGKKFTNAQNYMNKIRGKVYKFTPDPAYPTVPHHPDFKYTLIVKAVISGKKINRLSYVPCVINTNAEPQIYTRSTPEAQQVYDYVESISRDQNLNVRFSWAGDEVLISE